MADIHVNPDQMRHFASSLEWWSSNLRDNMMPTLRNLAGQLEGDWQGLSRQHYQQLIQTFQSSANNLMIAADDLGHHLMDTANRFESADNS